MKEVNYSLNKRKSPAKTFSTLALEIPKEQLINCGSEDDISQAEKSIEKDQSDNEYNTRSKKSRWIRERRRNRKKGDIEKEVE